MALLVAASAVIAAPQLSTVEEIRARMANGEPIRIVAVAADDSAAFATTSESVVAEIRLASLRPLQPAEVLVLMGAGSDHQRLLTRATRLERHWSEVHVLIGGQPRWAHGPDLGIQHIDGGSLQKAMASDRWTVLVREQDLERWQALPWDVRALSTFQAADLTAALQPDQASIPGHVLYLDDVANPDTDCSSACGYQYQLSSGREQAQAYLDTMAALAGLAGDTGPEAVCR